MQMKVEQKTFHLSGIDIHTIRDTGLHILMTKYH